MTAYVPMMQRSQWEDVEPTPQLDGPDPLVPIMYAEDYRDAMDYFRSISATGEQSDRVLELTEIIIRKNPAHYTVWGYRFQTLLALQKDLEAELELMNEFARVNLKTYQVWHHRLLLMSHISPKDPQSEIDYIHRALLPDPKNYHTWAYLHWLFSHFQDRISFKQWQDEREWCTEALRVDGRNNSAWGWRWYLYVECAPEKASEEYWQDEISFAVDAVHRIPHNVSAWNYLRGLLLRLNRSKSTVIDSLNRYASGESPVTFALEFKAEHLAEVGDREAAVALYDELSRKDPMRAAYWMWRASR
ncbi:hypothetical protein BD324DRAFT_620993 [Kockovaella imperatae]|uniref:Protein farnesyltransferase/geranylgeranyltransferase type-1 subunit alpha n=1 Tax=Kockovaella imperatae TaxID=4999 RepID=A0A1Y1ULW8_9TREE|nr:hypothetical protein BD324DRAFT_620993 [Kockovaella imperatae]ORX38476.1 hypothetical protein BD324DRAFT_620993 [Kockovaella imperatae]